MDPGSSSEIEKDLGLDFQLVLDVMTADDTVRRWLVDDPLVLSTLVALVATSFAVALVSCLCRDIRPAVDQRHADDSHSVLSAAFACLHLSVAHTVPSTTQQQSLSGSTSSVEEKDRKSTRSKERRRRGKDPFRDLLKGGKRSKALLKAITLTDRDHSPPSADTLSNSSIPLHDTASSTSRSQSPEPVTTLLDMDRLAPPLVIESGDGSARNTTPNAIPSSVSGIALVTDISDCGSLDTGPQTDSFCAHSSPSDSMTAADTEASISSASTIIANASEDVLSSPPISTTCPDIHTPQPRDFQATYTSGSYIELTRARTKLRLSRLDPSIKSSLLLSTPPPLPDNMAGSPNSILLTSISPTHSTDSTGPSTPTNSQGSTPPPRSLSSSEDIGQREPDAQPLDQSAAIELASMRSALEAAHLREEQLRIEAEQANKERDELRWGWNEEVGVWRRREAELQAQIHHLMQQLQAYAAVASFQAQQAASKFSSPPSPHAHPSPRLQQHPIASFPSPPVIQAQNSASAPAHVQALLASAPMLASHPLGYAAYPGAGSGMSPLLWSSLGLCVPNRDARHNGRRTSDSSASGSSSRGRRRRRRAENPRNASDESSLGDWDGIEDGSGDEDPWEEDEEEDIFRNNALADAILKRPESIRELSGVGKRLGGRPTTQGGGVGQRMEALKDPVSVKPGLVPLPVDMPAARQ